MGWRQGEERLNTASIQPENLAGKRHSGTQPSLPLAADIAGKFLVTGLKSIFHGAGLGLFTF